MTRTTRYLLVALPLFVGGCTENPYPYLAEGDAAMQTHRYNDAAAAYDRYLDISPGSPEVRAKNGKALLAAGRPHEAVEQLRVATQQQPDNEAWLDDLCAALLAANKNDELFLLLRTNAAQRGRVGDYIRMGVYSQKMGDGDTARTSLLTAARIDNGRTAAPQIALYDFYDSIGDKAAAMRRLRMAYYVDQRSTDVSNRVARSGAITGPTFGLPPSEDGQ